MTAHRDLIVTTARARHLSPNLVEAFVLKESSGDPWAWNPEPRYRYLWNVRTQAPFRKMTDAEQASEVPPADFPMIAGDRDQEWWAQQASWGLMQLMGALARELGFGGRYLTQLCEPELNLRYGCMHIAALMTWAKGDIRRAAAAYNGGRGGWEGIQAQQYAARIVSLVDSVNAMHPEGL